MKYPNLEKLEPGDLWRWCNYRADTIVCSEQIEADQHGWRQAADLIHDRGVELARAADTIERLQSERDDAKERADYRGESAKTLRSMSDDHRMVPDFSEQLLDIADAIESQAKELSQHRSELRGAHDAMEALAKALTKTEQERDAALAEVERLKGELRGIYSDQAASDKARAESNDLWRTER